MALTWDWNKRIGTAYFKSDVYGDFEISLYQGNAFLIMLNEYENDGKDVYDMFGFFVDEPHMKKCLGISKGCENLYDNEIYTLVKVDIDKNYLYLDKLIKALVKAFDSIDINVGHFEGTYKEVA